VPRTDKIRLLQICVHLSERLKPMFTVLEKCKFQAFLRDRINWDEIVAP
jgi:hypothetical protein